MNKQRRMILRHGLGWAAFASLSVPSFGWSTSKTAPIKVGVLLDLSGPLQMFGKVKAQCIKMAVDEINTAGGLLGRSIELVTYDTQSNNQLYAQFAQQLTLKDQVAVVHGAITAAAREVARPVLARTKTPFIMNMSNDGPEIACDRNMFITGATPHQIIDKLVPYMMQKYGKKVYVLGPDFTLGQIGISWTKRLAEQAGGQMVGSELFPLDVDKFGATINRIQSSKPDFVFNLFVGPSQAAFYGQWAAAGMNKRIPMASHTFGEAGEQLRMPPDVSEGLVTVKNYFDEIDSPANLEFLKNFQSQFSDYSYVGSLGMSDYQGIHLWAECVKKAGSTDRNSLIKAFETGVDINAPSGRVASHPQTHYCLLDMYLAEVRNGRFEIIDSWKQVPPVPEGDTGCDVLSMAL